MRDLVLNDLSLKGSAATIFEHRPLWREISRGMASLVNEGICNRVLRMTRLWEQYSCKGDHSLQNMILLAINERGEDLDEFRFLLRLSTKIPLDLDLTDDIVRQFMGCEAEEYDGEGGECLVLCSLLCGVAVSVPFDSTFDKDSLVVRYSEISADAEIGQCEVYLDNVCRSQHALAISQRYHASILGSLRLDNLWEKKGEAFPHLSFGGDVRKQLTVVDRRIEFAVIDKLAELNDTAREWKETETEFPKWKSQVTPESASLMQNENLREYRRFASCEGVTKIFEWHAKFAGQRIHLIFYPKIREIEIGYIGKHLPLK